LKQIKQHLFFKENQTSFFFGRNILYVNIYIYILVKKYDQSKSCE